MNETTDYDDARTGIMTQYEHKSESSVETGAVSVRPSVSMSGAIVFARIPRIAYPLSTVCIGSWTPIYPTPEWT